MLEVKNLVKVYKMKGGVETKALDDVSVTFPETGLVFLLGKSGSGKSTLLNMIGGLDRPDSGEIIVKGRSSKNFSQSDFDSYRNTYIGFIFQEYNVLNEFNIEQNISLALQLQGKKNDKEAVNALLKEVDLEGFNRRKPNTLSGGQKQRIAIARALIKQPEIIMADEPTGALDSNTGKQVLETLKKLSQNKLVIIVSHDQDFAEEYGDRIIELKDGKIISDKSKEKVPPKALNEKMQIINGNIIDIKNGSELTEADFKQLYQMIKKQNKEVLISTGEDNIKITKKAARITDDGSGERFTNTKEIETKKYDGKNTKFIRSHMPFSRAFKMGASSLKTKPIRLIFTILLATVSFTMFGVSSALMLYNESYSIATALEHEVRRSEAVNKLFNYTYASQTIDNKTGEVVETGNSYSDKRTTYFGAQEVKSLNDAHPNKFIGVFNFQTYVGSDQPFRFSTVTIPPASETKDYYNNFCGFDGLSDANASFFTANNYQLTGTHPVNDTDLAISNYTFDLLKTSEAYSVNQPDDIVGKKLQVSYYTNMGTQNIEFTITGVYNFGPLDSSFDALKQAKSATQSDSDRQNEVSKFAKYLQNSLYSIGYVAPSFYETYGFVPVEYNDEIRSQSFKGIDFAQTREEIETRDVTNDFRRQIYVFDTLSNGVKYYNSSFVESEKINITDNQVLLNYDQYHNDYLGEKYYSDLRSLYDQIQNYSLDGFNEVREQINQWYETDPTLEVVKAYKRLFDSYSDKWSSNPYPSEYNPDTDHAAVKSYFDNIYAKAVRRDYLSSVYNSLNSYFVYDSSLRPTNWDATALLADRLYNDGEPLDETEYNALTEGLAAGLTNETEYAIKCAMAKTLYDYSADYYVRTIYDIFNEVCGNDIYNVVNEIDNNYGQDADQLNNFTNAITQSYRTIYGVNPSFEFNPTFMTFKYNSMFSVPEKYYSKNVAGDIVEYTVAGFVDFGNEWSREPVLTRNALKNYFEQDYSYTSKYISDYEKPADEKYAFVISPTTYSKEDVTLFTAKNATYFYDMTNATYNQVSMFTNMIGQMKTIFLIVGAVTGVLSALLLLNFISVSISSKNKDIGILRAVGARGSDVFKIFFSESSVIALICFILAAIGGGVACYFINGSIRDTLGIALLDYGFINVALVLAVTLVISFIATIIPVSIASKKPPVEAIRSL